MEVIVECSAMSSINGEEKDESGYTKPERVMKFLVSFMVDARGGAMRGCRHSGVRVIIPPRKAAMPTRITCRYLKKEKLIHPPPLMEGEACASRILEMGPSGAKFLGPVIIEVPHFASLRGKEREITILRSDNGEAWREHTLEATEEAVQEVLNESFDGEELSALEDLNTNRITRILTTDFPQYFAIVSRVRQEVHAIGPEGGMVSSTVVPQVQAVFPVGALTKKIKVGLQAQPIPAELVAKMLGNRVAVSPIVTVEPRRRKFHKPIVLTIPVPQAASKGMLNQYSGDAPTLRLLCSITGGTTRAQWEDVTGSTPLSFVNDCVSFTTTVSARFWLMDCRNISEATKMATELYREAIHVPFMAKFVVFAKRSDPQEARLRVFCMTDDKEEKTLENQEHFVEVAKSRDVEVLESKQQYVEFAGNLVPVTKSGEQLSLSFHAFKENRLPFIVRVRDPHQDPAGRIAFMREPKVSRGDPPQTPICNLNIALPDIIKTESPPDEDLISIEKQYDYLTDVGLNKEAIHRAELRLSDIATLLGKDWTKLALQLEMAESDINVIKSEYPDDIVQQAIVMLRLWVQLSGNKATGNTLEKALRKINREDIVNQCIFNVELVTDDVEKAVAKVHLDQSGFDTLKEELGPSREASLRRDLSLDASYDEQDIMKEAESAEETSSDAGSLSERRLSGGPDVVDSVTGVSTRQEAKIVQEVMKDTVQVSDALQIETSVKPSDDYAPGDGLETARLAESETWTSQELDRSTPDLLQAGPDVITHGPTEEEEEEWQDEIKDEEWDVKQEEWLEKDESGLVTKKITKIQYSTKDGDADSQALSGKIEETKGAPAAAETPIEGPEAASKSKDQKMIEVTERVAEVASTLASTLEKAEKSAVRPTREKPHDAVRPPREDSKATIPTVTTPADVVKKEPEVTVTTGVALKDDQRDQLVDEDKWVIVDTEVQGAFDETKAMMADLSKRPEVPVSTGSPGAAEPPVKEVVDLVSGASVAEVPVKKVVDSPASAVLAEPPVKEVVDSTRSASPTELLPKEPLPEVPPKGEERAVKAEVKLLVKTSEMGRDAIEIRSIREFVEPEGAKQKSELSRIFAEAAASDVSPPISKPETAAAAPPLPPEDTKPPASPVQPCLGSLSIAYEEPPQYRPMVAEKPTKISAAEPLQPRPETVPDIMQQLAGTAPDLTSDIGDRVSEFERLGSDVEDGGSVFVAEDLDHGVAATQSDAGVSLTEISQDDKLLLSEIESPPIITSPHSERKLLSGKPKPVLHSPQILIVQEDLASDDHSELTSAEESGPKTTSKNVLVTEPPDEEVLIDRRHSSPDFGRLVTMEEQTELKPKEIEELETETWDPQRRAEFYSEGDFGHEQEYEEGVPLATTTGTRVVSHEIRRTIRGPDGEEIVIVETDDSYGQRHDDEGLHQTEAHHRQDS